MSHWTAQDIPWEAFQQKAVTPELLSVIKAAALVEGNAADYVRYLENVFTNDPSFIAAAQIWGVEERQHGDVLGRWCQLADPTFDYAQALKRFRDHYTLPLDRSDSVRGSRAGELTARCIVECGTSSFYSAIRDATSEPVLKTIAGKIAGDEFRHYRLFELHLRRYLDQRHLNRWHRLHIALGRILEVSDDELALAYWCGNNIASPYSRQTYSRIYETRAWNLYQFGHIQRGIGMALKACGLSAQGWLSQTLAKWGYRYMRQRIARNLKLGFTNH